MIVVLDTNVVLQALNRQNPISGILAAWHNHDFIWAISTEILLEYQEVILRQSGEARWRQFARLLDLSAKFEGNILQVSPSFFFRTISADRDDDKFADCAITSNAHWIVTNDGHFQPLIGSGYRPQPISPEKFMDAVLGRDKT